MPVFDTPTAITVVLDVRSGDVRISTSERPDTVVEVHPGDAGEGARVEFVDGTLTISVPAPPRRGLLSRLLGRTPEVTIDLPAGSHVRGSVTGETRASGRLGECRLRTSAGDIRLGHTGPAELTTRDGEIDVRIIDGAASITNTNGETRIGKVTGHLRLSDTNGEMSVDRALGDVDGRTAYGAISIGEVVCGTVTLATAGGELAVGIAADTSAWLDIDTAGGAVHNELDDASGPGASGETVEIHARTGGGDIRIHRAGDIRIHRAGDIRIHRA